MSWGMDGSLVHDSGLIRGVMTTEEQQRRASLFVASQATDVEDCRLLLDMLGLTGDTPRSSRTVRQQEAAVQSRERTRLRKESA